MRDGRFVARELTKNVTRRQMANLMVGRDLSDLYPTKDARPLAAPLLKVQGLTVPGWARDVSFEAAPGEIVGFAGLVGAGRTELFEGLLGLRPRSSGEIHLNGERVAFRDPKDAARHGVTYLSEDRKGRGLHVRLSLNDNLTLMDLDRHARPWLDRASQKKALLQAISDF